LEDIFSILVVILIAVASVNSKKKKKKAKAPEAKGPLRMKADDKGFGEMKEFIMDVGKAVLEMDDDDDVITSPAKVKPQKLKAKPAPKAPEHRREASVIEEGMASAPMRSMQGRSLFEDKGCVSGSIAHDSHEGDSNYPYGAAEGSYTQSPVYADEIAGELQSMNIHHLRRAIVISEILDKPKALRHH